MGKIDVDRLPTTNATGYPAELAALVAGRHYRRLGRHAGLEDFGVTHVTLDPGYASSQRHWHEDEDEFVVMLAGELVLVTDRGRAPMRAGDCAAFPKGEANAHHLVNESSRPAVFIAVGRPSASDCHYPDVDLHLDGRSQRYRRKDGRPY